jgi:anti-sigma factor RsiW
MYEDADGHRLSIILRPMAPDIRAPRFDFAEGPTNLCGWIDDGLGYAVVANLPDEVLDRITNQIKEQKTNSAG